jgi:hypothetical protein
MIVEESRMLQVSIFEKLQNNLINIDFSVLLIGVITIADEVDRNSAKLWRASLQFLGRGRTTACCRTLFGYLGRGNRQSRHGSASKHSHVVGIEGARPMQLEAVWVLDVPKCSDLPSGQVQECEW